MFGIVAIFVSIPNEQLIWCIGGLVVFAGLTLYDFWRLRRAGSGDVALIALSIFLDAFNIFLFMLQLLRRLPGLGAPAGVRGLLSEQAAHAGGVRPRA